FTSVRSTTYLLLSTLFVRHYCVSFFFFSTTTATTKIYTLSLHDALPISRKTSVFLNRRGVLPRDSRIALAASSAGLPKAILESRDRKSTRLNSSHQIISYAVFCLKKKKKNT